MSTDEILEVIREWIRQYQDLSKTYRWIQVIISCRILVIFAKILLNYILILNIKFHNSNDSYNARNTDSIDNSNVVVNF